MKLCHSDVRRSKTSNHHNFLNQGNVNNISFIVDVYRPGAKRHFHWQIESLINVLISACQISNIISSCTTRISKVGGQVGGSRYGERGGGQQLRLRIAPVHCIPLYRRGLEKKGGKDLDWGQISLGGAAVQPVYITGSSLYKTGGWFFVIFLYKYWVVLFRNSCTRSCRGRDYAPRDNCTHRKFLKTKLFIVLT